MFRAYWVISFEKMIYEEKIFSPEEVVLYRDDMLTLSEGSGPVIERRRKAMIKLFKEERLSITCESNLDRVQFLDVLFDLKDGSYRPYHKINAKVQYVSTFSNHPRIVLDNIPRGINQRLVNISSDENSFNSEKNIFQEALRKSGYSHVLSYSFHNDKNDRVYPRHVNRNGSIQQDNGNTQKRRRDNIIWFNPPFNLFCSTNVGREFRSLISKHFLRGTDLGMLFNHNKLKISYSCLPNLK